MWDRKEIKLRGKEKSKANYWRSVLSAFLLSVLLGGSAITGGLTLSDDDATQEITTDDGGVVIDEETLQNAAETFNSMPEEDKAIAGMLFAGAVVAIFVIIIIGILLRIFVFNPLEVGCYGFFRENAKGLQPDLGVLKSGFTKYGHTFVTLFLRDLFLCLWCCLFIVPGLIKAYSYRMVPFILRDHPELSAREVITRSRQIMDGHKWNVFVFDLSYLGWFLLGCITCGLVNIFWTEPYRENANAALYLSLIGETEEKADEPFEPEEVIPRSSN